MTESEFTEIVSSTREIVLSAIEKNLAERFSYAIDAWLKKLIFEPTKPSRRISFAKNQS